MKIAEIIKHIEQTAPLSLQESYDNAGLIVGSYGDEVDSALISLDVTEEVVEEAIEKKAGIIIAHHPIVFKGLKRFNGSNYVERTVIKAIKNNIAIYAAHTNLDNVPNGVNGKICDKLGLINRKILSPANNNLYKLVTFVPQADAEKVRSAIFNIGAGTIGDYDCCSFNTEGKGTFRGNDNTDPYVGEKNKLHFEEEVKIETIVPKHKLSQAVSAMMKAHPYEEVAYDVYPLENRNPTIGSGMVAELPEAIPTKEFLQLLKTTFSCGCIKHTELITDSIKKVALCGGSGSFLLRSAIGSKADIFITGDFKYHEFFDAENKIIIADIGHYESEQYTKEVIFDILNEKLFNFALYKSTTSTNPIKYF